MLTPVGEQQDRKAPVEVGQQFPRIATFEQAGCAEHEELDGVNVGGVVIITIGAFVGTVVGDNVMGIAVGDKVVGLIEGGTVIAPVGTLEGVDDGFCVGENVGARVVGLMVGDPVVTKVRGSTGRSVDSTG